ncbi:MAG: rhodanese-like domain-containing protein [Chitinophagia bacterium]|nr:rhodanese-like domain-containing protein [Chitinophagia bacterium]
MDFLKKLFSSGPATDFGALVKEGALIVDVRTPAEFNSGHNRGSVNIPLDRLKGKVEELRKKGKPVITCCRSGNRSGMAKSMLTAAGLNCYNGGAWDSLQRKLDQS